jgi:dihydrodipicolinate synthase/N-acetylneuraminate lyase
MRPLETKEICGTWATLLLPIKEDEGIDFLRLEDEIEYLLASGVDGIYTNGTAGEFWAQSEEEFHRIHLLVAEGCEKAGVAFQIGVSHMSPQVSMQRLKRAVEFGPGAIQVILPDWLPLTDDETIDFLQRMSEAADPIGLVLYNPPHAKRVLEPVVYSKLKEAVPSLVGVKVVDGDAAWYVDMQKHAANLSVFVPGHHLASGIHQGAAGSYSNVACLSPSGAQGWYELMKTDIEAALEIEARLRSFMDEHIAPLQMKYGYSNAALDKLLAAIGGWSDVGTRLRWPYRWILGFEAERLRPIAKQTIPELFPESS